jgi:hypothetical protein
MCSDVNHVMFTLTLWAVAFVSLRLLIAVLWDLLGRYQYTGRCGFRGRRRVRETVTQWWIYDMDWFKP